MDATQAILFRQLREHYQKRDRLRLIVDYRKKFLDSLVRGGDEEGSSFTSPRPSPHRMRGGRTNKPKRSRTRITRRQRRPWPGTRS